MALAHKLDTNRERHVQPVPGGRQGGGKWLVVALLSLMFAMSLLDRMILGILANPVGQALRLADSELGLLMGTGFAVLYSVASLPMAHAIDSANRKRMVIFGVTLWSVMTIVSGFATDFTQLLLARSGVAIGEAVLTPAAVSLIADLFAKDQRRVPMTIFTSVGAIMATAAFALGGLALALGGMLTSRLGLAPWRLTFIIVGIPGLLLTLSFLIFVREPARSGGAEQAEEAGFLAFLDYTRKHWWFYVPLFASSGAFCLFNYSMFSWMPTIMVRAHGYQPADAGFIFGFVMTPIQLAAIYFWPRLAMRVERSGTNKGVPLALFCAALLALPLYVIAPLMTNKYLFIGGLSLTLVSAAAWAVLPTIGFQLFSPKRMVGRLSALNLLVMNLVGYGLGPVLTVYFGQAWRHVDVPAHWGLATDSLARGLATNGLIAAPIMIVCTWICLKTAHRLGTR